jgi:hypothetical protein
MKKTAGFTEFSQTLADVAIGGLITLSGIRKVARYSAKFRTSDFNAL